MQTANIATAKNQFSQLIRQVKRGCTIVITERDHPVARLCPLESSDVALADLQQKGLILPPMKSNWDLEAFLEGVSGEPCLSHGKSLVDAVLEEREEGR